VSIVAVDTVEASFSGLVWSDRMMVASACSNSKPLRVVVAGASLDYEPKRLMVALSGLDSVIKSFH